MTHHAKPVPHESTGNHIYHCAIYIYCSLAMVIFETDNFPRLKAEEEKMQEAFISGSGYFSVLSKFLNGLTVPSAFLKGKEVFQVFCPLF